MLDEKSKDTYSNNHLFSNFQFYSLYLGLKNSIFIRLCDFQFHLDFTNVIFLKDSCILASPFKERGTTLNYNHY